MGLDCSSRGGMGRYRRRSSSRDSRRVGRALRIVCRRLMSRRFRGTIKCRSERGGSYGGRDSSYHGAAGH